MQIDIWSDVVCPWCYVGHRRFAAALAGFAHAGGVQVRHRAFRLDPAAESDHPGEPSPSHTERLAVKFGTDTTRIETMHADLTALGAADGIDFRFDRVRSADTRDAHRLLHLATTLGVEDAVLEAFFHAVFTAGEAMGDRETLRRVGIAAGLPEADVDDVLDTDRYAVDVADDLDTARRLGVTGVPFFVLDGRLGVSGAQSTEVLTAALTQAWDTAARV